MAACSFIRYVGHCADIGFHLASDFLLNNSELFLISDWYILGFRSFTLIEISYSDLRRSGPIEKALTYFRSRKKELDEFLDEGVVQMDRNVNENTAGSIPIGRNNCIFVGSQGDAYMFKRGTAKFYFFTIPHTCILWRI